MGKSDLEDRLIEFAVSIIEIINEIPKSKAGQHLSGQLVRSGTSPALNYGEAKRAESRRDFIHKIQIVLKELGETLVILKILHRTNMYTSEKKFLRILKECDELIAIFVKSVHTAKSKQKRNANS
ncbi:four helix bundle protein [Rhodohalobacter sp. 614A]|uniref:four helix bundle protein n=1 Tax=Rhodohalobacter sp. 614A TaxID=2908649 RepID=UPI001F44A6EB|nr:four helix bundle protein [Rhodohalobacter sp. 614A]